MTRKLTAAIVSALIGALLAFDLAATGTPDIHDQPALIALGSGAEASGAHCAALPTK